LWFVVCFRGAPIQGFTFYDGPVWVEDVWFDGFISTNRYKAGAISYRRYNIFASSGASGIRGAKWGFNDGVSTLYKTKDVSV